MNPSSASVTRPVRRAGQLCLLSLTAFSCAEGSSLPNLPTTTASDTGGTTDSTSSARGGAVSTGGTLATGGVTATGGVAPTGGAKATGGSVGVGGATSTGGVSVAAGGGAVGTGGASSTSVPGTGGSSGVTAGATSRGGNANSGGSSHAGGTSVATAGSGPGCAAGALFCDDFEDGNSTGWTPRSGTWTVVLDGATNHVYQGPNGSFAVIETATDAATDQTVEADMKVTNFASASTTYYAGIVARFSATGLSANFFYLAVDGSGKLMLRKTATSGMSSTSGTCGNITLPTGTDVKTWNRYKLFVVGTPPIVRAMTYFNGVLQHDCTTTATDSATSGSAGVMTGGTGTTVMFDNFTVTGP